MIIVSSTVKADESESHQFFNLIRRRIDHSYNGLSFALDFPVHKEQIRENLNIIEYQLSIIVLHRCGRVSRFKLHLINQLDTVICLMSAVRCKCQYCIAHICNIVFQITCIRVFQYLVDKIDTGLSSRMYLFIKIPFDQCSKPFLALNRFKIYHFLFSFQR